ncbi:caprin-2 isoform X3 [Carassius gibelio]|uniref:caprin-2 isoform X3 n=1 Tax=Carassius gibelio TaxID=101364 RepID=UPI002277CA25|nr:caprin-2 isoform X3 [Carassius gibelio]
MRETEIMVQLSPSRTIETLTPSELTVEKEDGQGSPKSESPRVLTAFQFTLSPTTTTYYGYEQYIEEGLICLKHKIRNIEKKKLKLESYSEKLKKGDKLNQDQLEAVGKYEEVVHNLHFAKELQKTIGALTQDLLKTQRKVARQEKVMRIEEERKRLSLTLQVQYVLHSLQREDVRRNFCNMRQHSRYLSTQDMESLLDLASLLGCKRDHSMSLEDQMEQAAIVYWELLEGKEGPVAGSTYKHMKAKLLQLVDCGFFDHIPLSKVDSQEKAETRKADPPRPCGLSTLVKLSSKEVPSKEFLNRQYLPVTDVTERRPDEKPSPRSWKEELLALKEREPPDSWEMEFSDPPASSQSPIQKPWKGAAGLIPKTADIVKRPTVDPKEKRQRKSKGEQDSKPMPVAVEVFSSQSPLPKDPAQRKQQLESLMDQISGSFSFMQESLLDGETSPLNSQTKRCRPSPGSSTPIAQRELTKSPSDILPQSQRSTPLQILLSGDAKGCLSNEDLSINDSDLDLHHEEKPNKQGERFTSPPLYRRGSSISVPLENQSTVQAGKQTLCNGVSTTVSATTFSTPPSHRSVFNVASLPINESSGIKSDESGFSESMHQSYTSAKSQSYSTASTQTPPELSLPEDDVQIEGQYQLECPVSVGGHVFSGSQPQSRPGQSCYPRSSARGMTRAGRGLGHSYRSPGGYRGGYDAYRVNIRSPGGGFISQTHTTHRDPASAFYVSRENGYQQSFKQGGGTATQRSSAGWSDSSQVSSPDRERVYPLNSGISDTHSIPPMEGPITPQGPHTLMPVHVYPLTQLRVAFSAARTANFAPGTLDQPIAFDLLHTNLGDLFDTTTGRFTCPAAGAYVFIFHILKLAISVPLYINLMRNEEVMVSAYANDGAPDHDTASNHTILQLFQGDQVWLRLHRGAIYGSSWKYSTFSGFLLYQD